MHPGDSFAQLTVTAELDEPLRVLKRDLDFLSRALGTAVFRRVWRDALEKLSSMLWTEVLMSSKFAASGAAQFARDIHAICALVERYLPDVGHNALASLVEGVRLLSLPASGEEVQGGGGEDGREKEGGGKKEEEEPMTLQMASDWAFMDGDHAKKLLETLEIETLSPANARQILRRRVENSE